MRNIFHNCLPLHDGRPELSNVVFLLRHPRSIDLNPGKWNCSEVFRRPKVGQRAPFAAASLLLVIDPSQTLALLFSIADPDVLCRTQENPSARCSSMFLPTFSHRSWTG